MSEGQKISNAGNYFRQQHSPYSGIFTESVSGKLLTQSNFRT